MNEFEEHCSEISKLRYEKERAINFARIVMEFFTGKTEPKNFYDYERNTLTLEALKSLGGPKYSDSAIEPILNEFLAFIQATTK